VLVVVVVEEVVVVEVVVELVVSDVTEDVVAPVVEETWASSPEHADTAMAARTIAINCPVWRDLRLLDSRQGTVRMRPTL
jgi:hypothetical protein